MKKIISVTLATASIAAACLFASCSMGEAKVNYTLSEDGTYYIVSSVTGNKNALGRYEILSTYSAGEGEPSLPVKAIGDYAFYQCASLNTVIIPDSITEIGNVAFGLSGLIYVDIPDSVETIGYSAFSMCTHLESIVIPESVTYLGDRAFRGCTSLKRAEVYAQVSDLQFGTFENPVVTSAGNIYINSSLTEIVLPASLTKISSSAISGNKLTDIYFMGSEEQWNDLYFYMLRENEDENAESPFVEEKVEKKDYIPHTTTIHFDYVPEAQG
ncbi:MAG: leucine-rich repeat domain-containing protein [Candidatus Coproplasma sp.]